MAQALIHQPELIFLDEPTSGLDPMGRRLVRDIIRAQCDRGATVFLNSHLLSEIEITLDQVVFIREGEVVTSRDLRTVTEEEVQVAVRARHLSDETVKRLDSLTTSAAVDGERLTFAVRSRESLPEILRCLVASGSSATRSGKPFDPLHAGGEQLNFLRLLRGSIGTSGIAGNSDPKQRYVGS